MPDARPKSPDGPRRKTGDTAGGRLGTAGLRPAETLFPREVDRKRNRGGTREATRCGKFYIIITPIPDLDPDPDFDTDSLAPRMFVLRARDERSSLAFPFSQGIVATQVFLRRGASLATKKTTVCPVSFWVQRKRRAGRRMAGRKDGVERP